jgi:hypothetical protein
MRRELLLKYARFATVAFGLAAAFFWFFSAFQPTLPSQNELSVQWPDYAQARAFQALWASVKQSATYNQWAAACTAASVLFSLPR